LVRAGDEDRVEDGLVSAPLALAGVGQGFCVSLGCSFVNSLVLVAVGHAQRDAQSLEVARCVALEVRLEAFVVHCDNIIIKYLKHLSLSSMDI
jgi:hypothetical protein